MYTGADLMNYVVRLSPLSTAQKELELVNKQREYANAVSQLKSTLLKELNPDSY